MVMISILEMNSSHAIWNGLRGCTLRTRTRHFCRNCWWKNSRFLWGWFCFLFVITGFWYLSYGWSSSSVLNSTFTFTFVSTLLINFLISVVLLPSKKCCLTSSRFPLFIDCVCFRIRLLCHILHLYLTQQTVSPAQPPRCTVNAPVLNSRIQAFKEMCAMKSYSTHHSLFSMIQGYFNQVQTYHIGHLQELFARVVKSLFTENYLVRLYDT